MVCKSKLGENCTILLLLCIVFQEIRQAAEFLELPELLAFLHNIQTREEFLNNDVRQQYRQVFIDGIEFDKYTSTAFSCKLFVV